MATGIRIIGIVPGRHVGSSRDIRAIRILVSLVHHRAALRISAISGVSGSRGLLRLLKAGVAVAAIRTTTRRSVALLLLLLGLIRAGGTIISLGASSWIPWGVIRTITRRIGIISERWFSGAMMLPRLVCLGVAVLDCRRVRSRSRGTVSGISRGDDTSAAVARGLHAAFPIPSSRVGLEILDHGLRIGVYHFLVTGPGKKAVDMAGRKRQEEIKTHGRQVTISRDIITLDGLTSLWVLKREQPLATTQACDTLFKLGVDKLVLLKLAYLIMARSHQSIIAQVAANISRDDFTIDAITGHEVLVHASRGSRHRGQ